jgi:hypothetical protein
MANKANGPDGTAGRSLPACQMVVQLNPRGVSRRMSTPRKRRIRSSRIPVVVAPTPNGFRKFNV